MLVRPMLLHRMALVSVRLFCKNLGNLQEFFGQMVYCPPWQKIARTPMVAAVFRICGNESQPGLQLVSLSYCVSDRSFHKVA